MFANVECDECGRPLSPAELADVAADAGVPKELLGEMVTSALCTKCGGGFPVVELDD